MPSAKAMIIDIPPARVDPDTSVFSSMTPSSPGARFPEVLDKLGVQAQTRDQRHGGWTRFRALLPMPIRAGRNIRDEIRLILVDAEMPEMDGYVLTKNIKSDPRFQKGAGGHAFFAVVGSQPGDGQGHRCRCLRGQI